MTDFFEKLFRGNFIYSQSFCQKSPKKYFSYFVLNRTNLKTAQLELDRVQALTCSGVTEVMRTFSTGALEELLILGLIVPFLIAPWTESIESMALSSQRNLWCVLFYKENVTILQGALKNC